MNRHNIKPDRKREPLRLLGARIKVTGKPLAMPFGHDDHRGGAACDFVFSVDDVLDQASSVSTSPLSVRLIGPFG